jgi:hypothetical protein
VRETHFASLALDLPSREVAGDEPTILGSFVNNAEGRARHCYENFVIQNLNGNFRSHESGQVHVCPAF